MAMYESYEAGEKTQLLDLFVELSAIGWLDDSKRATTYAEFCANYGAKSEHHKKEFSVD